MLFIFDIYTIGYTRADKSSYSKSSCLSARPDQPGRKQSVCSGVRDIMQSRCKCIEKPTANDCGRSHENSSRRIRAGIRGNCGRRGKLEEIN